MSVIRFIGCGILIRVIVYVRDSPRVDLRVAERMIAEDAARLVDLIERQAERASFRMRRVEIHAENPRDSSHLLSKHRPRFKTNDTRSVAVVSISPRSSLVFPQLWKCDPRRRRSSLKKPRSSTRSFRSIQHTDASREPSSEFLIRLRNRFPYHGFSPKLLDIRSARSIKKCEPTSSAKHSDRRISSYRQNMSQRD